MIGSGRKEELIFNDDSRSSTRGRRSSGGSMPRAYWPDVAKSDGGVPMAAELVADVEERNSLLVFTEIDSAAIDHLFVNSASLSDSAIVDFVHHLCAISREEMSSPTNPRMFSMRKVVEIAYFNMSRIRIVWSRIWKILGEHFREAALHPNEQVASFSIDSVRQLAMKFK